SRGAGSCGNRGCIDGLHLVVPGDPPQEVSFLPGGLLWRTRGAVRVLASGNAQQRGPERHVSALPVLDGIKLRRDGSRRRLLSRTPDRHVGASGTSNRVARDAPGLVRAAEQRPLRRVTDPGDNPWAVYVLLFSPGCHR